MTDETPLNQECPDKACAATGPEGCRYPNWMLCGHPVERPSRTADETSPQKTKYEPGTLLQDKAGHYWLVRDDGQTAAGTNGGVMVDLRRGEPVYSPEKEKHD